MRRTAHSIARTGPARMRDVHLQAANDPLRPVERRAVAWMLALCLVLAAAILAQRAWGN